MTGMTPGSAGCRGPHLSPLPRVAEGQPRGLRPRTRTLSAGAMIATIAVMAALLDGCAAVGPNYDGPPQVARSAVGADAFHRAGVAPVSPAPPPARWWEAVGDPVLTRLIDDAFAASPTLAGAVARVRSARAQQAQNQAGLGPTGSVGGRYVRGKIPTGSFLSGSSGSGSASGGGSSSIPDPIDLDSYSVTSDATWEIDLFGGKRRGIESAAAAAEAQQAQLEDAQVTLASEMTQAYTRLREAQHRAALANRTVRLRVDSLALTRFRRERGTAADGDLERAQAELAQARAERPALLATIDQQLDQIATLAGRAPGAYDVLLRVDGGAGGGADVSAGAGVPAGESAGPPVALPQPPALVPVGQPADWLRRRPDIRQAERTLAARNAAIGSNVAALFPSVSVLGFVGTTGSHLGDLFKGSPLWLVTPSLSWNFLSIPTNRAKVRGAEADRDAALADYQRSVLTALQDANDSLAQFGRQREALAQREIARDAAARSAGIVRQRYAAGTASLIDALDSERQRVQTEDA